LVGFKKGKEMIIFNDVKLIEAKFDNEQELEDVVLANFEYFFGPSSILIPKKLIKTKDGFGTIPDGFAVDISSRIWFIVEAELIYHNVWGHIAPQVAKQLIATIRPETRQLLTEVIVQMVTNNENVKDKFIDEKIKEIDIRKVLAEIFEKPPIIGMPIDSVTNDLKEWAETLKNDVRLWVVKKYIQFGKPEIVAYDIPEEFKPSFDTSNRGSNQLSGITNYDVSLIDLIDSGLVAENEQISMVYKPRGRDRKTYMAQIDKDGSISVLGKKFSSPSYAAIFCIQDAGSDRKTVNGWTSWKISNGKFLSELRSEYLDKKEKEAEQGN
jgi:hypothetical protein